MNAKQLFRMRSRASGREALAQAEPGTVFVDRETGEEMEPVGMALPLAPSASASSTLFGAGQQIPVAFRMVLPPLRMPPAFDPGR